MKYLIYTETFPSRIPGSTRQTGIGRYCADLATGLASLGHEVTIVTNEEVGWTEGAGEPYQVRILGRAPRTRLEILHRRRQVLMAVRGAIPDYLLVGDPLAHGVVSLGRNPNVRYCPVLYGSELVAWGHAALDRAWLPGRRFRRWLTRRYLASAHATVCISRYTARLLSDLSPDAAGPSIAYPCVSSEFLSRPLQAATVEELHRGLTRDGKRPMILITVARISERKNQLGVLQAMAHIQGKTDIPFHYVIVGNVDGRVHDAYLEKIRAFVAAHGLHEAVTVVGNTTDEQKIDYIDAADIPIMLSRKLGASVEGFGISAIEGACRGKPVVVSDQGGMPETILEGVTGFAVSPDDPRRVAEVLMALARDPERRKAMGAAGRRFTLEQFTPAATAMQLHRQLVDRGKPPHRAQSQPRGVMTV